MSWVYYSTNWGTLVEGVKNAPKGLWCGYRESDPDLILGKDT